MKTDGNTSQAVMNRRQEPKDSLENFPTPPWATRALCERLNAMGIQMGNMTVWEPACGQGFMARPLCEYFGRVWATDVKAYEGWNRFGQYGIAAHEQRDFLAPVDYEDPPDAIITNPPFRHAMQFVHQAIDNVRTGGLVAMLCRTNFVESADRWHGLFAKDRPRWIWQFSERVPMQKGLCNHAGTTATAYAWFVWRGAGCLATQFDWLRPGQRKALENLAIDYSHPGGSKWNSLQVISPAASSTP